MGAPIMFAADASDNPNKGLGILNGCAEGELFTEGTWNADFCDAMKPKDGDIVVKGKKGLDAFPGSDLEDQLKANGIETVAIGGFLTDCMATQTEEGQKGATEGTFGMFSAPMTSTDF